MGAIFFCTVAIFNVMVGGMFLYSCDHHNCMHVLYAWHIVHNICCDKYSTIQLYAVRTVAMSVESDLAMLLVRDMYMAILES